MGPGRGARDDEVVARTGRRTRSPPGTAAAAPGRSARTACSRCRNELLHGPAREPALGPLLVVDRREDVGLGPHAGTSRGTRARHRARRAESRARARRAWSLRSVGQRRHAAASLWIWARLCAESITPFSCLQLAASDSLPPDARAVRQLFGSVRRSRAGAARLRRRARGRSCSPARRASSSRRAGIATCRCSPLRRGARAAARGDRPGAALRLAGHAARSAALVRDVRPELVVAWGMRSAIACLLGRGRPCR